MVYHCMWNISWNPNNLPEKAVCFFFFSQGKEVLKTGVFAPFYKLVNRKASTVH